MAREPYLIAFDIGSNSVKLAIAKEPTDESNKLQILALVEKTSNGIKRGVITNMSEATESLVEAIVQAESIIGLPIRKAVFGLNGMHIGYVNSEGLVVVSRMDNEITESDVDRVVSDALTKAFGLTGQEVLHIIPKSFTVDSQEGIRHPVGMIGSKLQAKTLIIGIESSYFRNFNKVISQAGVENLDSIYTPLATSDFVLSSRQKKAGTIMIDIGYSSTSYIVCEGEEIFASGVIPIGSDHITSDLAIGLGTTIEMAEDIKKKYLDLSFDADPTVTEIEMYNSEMQINERFIMDQIKVYSRFRVEEIFNLVKIELKKIDKFGKLPGGAVLVGGGSNLKGIDHIGKEILKLPIYKYQFDRNKVDFVPDYNGDPAFINVIALLHYYLFSTDETTSISKRQVASKLVPANISNVDINSFVKKIWPW
ncbi:MAG: cell division protein FtsA [Patescibacteria group bacterium]